MELAIGYKVVKQTGDNRLVSAIIDGKKFLTEYKVGDLVKTPIKGTGLLAFKALEEAKSFFYHERKYVDDGTFKIFEAILLNPKELPWVFSLYNSCFRTPTVIQRNWKSLFEGEFKASNKANMEKEGVFYRIAPKGTLACSGIQLVKEIVVN